MTAILWLTSLTTPKLAALAASAFFTGAALWIMRSAERNNG